MDEFDKLARELSEEGVTKSNMFGMPVLKLGRRPIAGLTEDGVNFKLPVDSEEMSRALALSGSHLFQPKMPGRKGPPMKQWVVVPFAHSDSYGDLIMASMKFVASDIK